MHGLTGQGFKNARKMADKSFALGKGRKDTESFSIFLDMNQIHIRTPKGGAPILVNLLDF